jgi:hypothetical protein
MPYKISKLESSAIITVIYSGEVSLEQRMALITDLSIEHIQNANPKILIDARSLLTSMTETEQKIWGNFIASREEFLNASVALIINPEINRTAIEQSQSLGHVIQQFDNEKDALNWLSERS